MPIDYTVCGTLSTGKDVILCCILIEDRCDVGCKSRLQVLTDDGWSLCTKTYPYSLNVISVQYRD